MPAAAPPAPATATPAGVLPRILFVDDDEAVLAGIRTTLRRSRNHYDLVFSNNPMHALALLDDQRIDVVVTDMRMPQMTGTELLWRLKHEHPEVVRYVLSGEADRSLVLGALAVTHRWLTKPCAREELTEALADAVRYRSLAADPELQAAVGGVDALPSPPALYTQIMGLIRRDAPTAEIAKAAASDTAIAAKIMQWANSAFIGHAKVADLGGALARIGVTAVSHLVMSEEALRSLDPEQDIPGLEARTLTHLVGSVGDAAAALAHPDVALAARTAGVLSMSGLLLATTRLRDRLVAAYQMADQEDLPLLDAQAQLCGLTHPDLAGHLLSIWGLPADLVLAVATSHVHPDPRSEPPFGVIDAVRAGRLVAQRKAVDARLPVGAPHLDRLDADLAAAVDGWTQHVDAHLSGADHGR